MDSISSYLNESAAKYERQATHMEILRETIELLHEQIHSLKQELADKLEELHETQQELHNSNRELRLMNQEISLMEPWHLLSFNEAKKFAEALLVKGESTRWVIAKLLGAIYGRVFAPDQLGKVESPVKSVSAAPTVCRTQICQRFMALKGQQEELRGKQIDLGIQFVSLKAHFAFLQSQLNVHPKLSNFMNQRSQEDFNPAKFAKGQSLESIEQSRQHIEQTKKLINESKMLLGDDTASFDADVTGSDDDAANPQVERQHDQIQQQHDLLVKQQQQVDEQFEQVNALQEKVDSQKQEFTVRQQQANQRVEQAKALQEAVDSQKREEA